VTLALCYYFSCKNQKNAVLEKDLPLRGSLTLICAENKFVSMNFYKYMQRGGAWGKSAVSFVKW